MNHTRITKISIIFLLCLLFLIPGSSKAQQEIQIIEYAVEIQFPEVIQVVFRFNEDSQLHSGKLFLQSRGSNEITQLNSAMIDGDTISWDYSIDDSTSLAFFEITNFWIEVEHNDGQSYQSPVFAFFFSDSRFEWEQFSQDDLIVYIQKEQTDSADQILGSSSTILENLQSLDGLAKPDEFKLVVYSESINLENIPPTLRDPYIIQLSNETNISFQEQQHISLEILDQIIGVNYEETESSIPDWVKIGAATTFGQNPSDISVIQSAVLEPSTVLDISELCNAQIPQDMHNPIIAAQTSSLLNFLENTYGIDAFYSIIGAAVRGDSCESILDAAGKPTDSIVREWMVETFTSTQTIQSPIPWFILLICVCIPVFSPLLIRRKRR